MERSIAISTFCAIVVSATLQAAEQSSPIVDLSELGLQITETTISQAIQKENHIRFVPQPPDQLVVVTMKGKAVRDCRIVMDNTAFAAVFDESRQGAPATRSIVKSKAIFVSGEWSIPSKPGGYVIVMPEFGKSEIVEIKAAFQLPAEVKDFTVTYPTEVKGRALLPQTIPSTP